MKVRCKILGHRWTFHPRKAMPMFWCSRCHEEAEGSILDSDQGVYMEPGRVTHIRSPKP